MKVSEKAVGRIVKIVIAVLSALLGAIGGTTLSCFAVAAFMQI